MNMLLTNLFKKEIISLEEYFKWLEYSKWRPKRVVKTLKWQLPNYLWKRPNSGVFHQVLRGKEFIKTIQISISDSLLTPFSTIIDLDRLGHTSPHNATIVDNWVCKTSHFVGFLRLKKICHRLDFPQLRGPSTLRPSSEHQADMPYVQWSSMHLPSPSPGLFLDQTPPPLDLHWRANSQLTSSIRFRSLHPTHRAQSGPTCPIRDEGLSLQLWGLGNMVLCQA